MINADRIRNMSNEELVKFIHRPRIDCTDYCDDFGVGCALTCKHEQGKEFIRKWLQKESEE